MGRYADDFTRTEQFSRRCRIPVLLSQVDAVSIQLVGQDRIVVDDERDSRLIAESLQFFTKGDHLGGRMQFRTELDDGDAAVDCRLHPLRQSLSMIGNKVEPPYAGGSLIPVNDQSQEIFVHLSFHRCSCPSPVQKNKKPR